MELIELVAQGLKHAPPLVRVAFNPGVTALAAGPGERLLVRLVADLLYPQGVEATLGDLDASPMCRVSGKSWSRLRALHVRSRSARQTGGRSSHAARRRLFGAPSFKTPDSTQAHRTCLVGVLDLWAWGPTMGCRVCVRRPFCIARRSGAGFADRAVP